MLKPIRYALTAVAALTCLAFLQDDFGPEQKQLLTASFEKVWTTVKDVHYDPDLGGLDWQGVYEKYKPRIENASSNEEGRNIMNEMLGLLGQTHIKVIPASAYDDLHGENKGDHAPGIDIRILDGRAIVTRVEANSPASLLGVKPGWEIVRVDGKPVAPIIERNEKNYSKSTLKDLNGARAVEGLIAGQPSQAVEIEFNDGKGVKTLKLDKAEPKGEKTTFGDMPSSNFWVETSCTKDDVRIISFNIWLNPEAVARAFSEIMKDAEKAKGFIIDLRGNPGGIGNMAMGAAGWFTSQKGLKLGTMTMRNGKTNFVVFPRGNATNAPLAILVDGCSGSTTEVFAGGMQDLKRARIFGTRTAGAALPSAFTRLPNGDGFQFILANYVSEGGKPLEGLGVTPDETIALTQADLLAGRDTVLDRAVAWIKSH